MGERNTSRRLAALFAYKALFRGDGTVALVATSVLARLSFGLYGVAAIVLVERQTGSFGIAGSVVGLHAIGMGLSAPYRGRLLDRFGTRSVVAPMSAVNALTIVALPLSAGLETTWLLLAVGLISGATVPPLVPAMRLEWQRLLPARSQDLTRAYAFEASAQLTVFLVGPLLAAGSLAVSGPQLPLLTSAACIAIGGPLFAVRARARPSADAEISRGLGSITVPGIQTLVLVTAIADAALGAVDVAAVAVAVERGHPAAGGILLALFALGSVVGALLYGGVAWKAAARQRLFVILLAFAAALALVGLAGPLVLLAGLLLLAGAPSAALWVTTSVALDDVAPKGQEAEAYTWLSSANAAGIAAGGVLGGAVIDRAGADAAFAVAAGLALLAAVALKLRRRSLVSSDLTSGTLVVGSGVVAASVGDADVALGGANVEVAGEVADAVDVAAGFHHAGAEGVS